MYELTPPREQAVRLETGQRPSHSKTLREHLRDGVIAAHRRRPLSFYLLLLIPIVLLLGLQMAQFRDQPWRFANVLTLLFLFCGAVLFLAVIDLFAIARRQIREHREAFRETLGDETFFRELGSRVEQRLDQQGGE